MELTDLHNRRANIDYVAKWHQERERPLVVWPEDKIILRISDLPVIEGTTSKVGRVFYPSNDNAFRDQIEVDKRYSRCEVQVGGMVITEVSEYR